MSDAWKELFAYAIKESDLFGPVVIQFSTCVDALSEMALRK